MGLEPTRGAKNPVKSRAKFARVSKGINLGIKTGFKGEKYDERRAFEWCSSCEKCINLIEEY